MIRSARRAGLVAIGAFLSFAVAASPAVAVTGPQFFIAGTPLAGSETLSLVQEGAQVLAGNGEELECSTVSASGGEIKGTEPGTASFTLVYGGCHMKGKTPAECEARTKGGSTPEQIKTKALNGELVKASKTPGGPVDLLVKPASGNFAEIEFKGTNCTQTSVTVSGSVAFEDEEGEHVEDVLKAPSTPIKNVYTESGTETKVSLKAFGFLEATYTGKDKVRLAGGAAGDQWARYPQCLVWSSVVKYPFGWKVEWTVGTKIYWKNLERAGNLNHEPKEPEIPKLWQKETTCP